MKAVLILSSDGILRNVRFASASEQRRDNRKEIREAGTEGGEENREQWRKGRWILGAHEGCQEQVGVTADTRGKRSRLQEAPEEGREACPGPRRLATNPI